MKHLSLTLIVLALLLAGRNRLMASIVTETEGVSQVLNNTLATAQWLSLGDFSLAAVDSVHQPTGWSMASVAGANGGNDVDFYAFTTPSACNALFDIDGTSGFDSLLSLFQIVGTSNTVIAQGNDSALPELGSSTLDDAFLGVIPLSAGTSYFIAVSTNSNYPKGVTLDTNQNYVRPDGNVQGGYKAVGSTGGGDFRYGNASAGTGKSYTLNISLSAVPEPSSFVLLSLAAGLLGACACRCRTHV